MDKSKKLKVVFDFIADYLSDEEKVVIEPMTEETREELTITENNSDEEVETAAHLKRAYTIMKKIDERDASKAITSHAVNEATRPLKKQIEETKRRFDEVQNSTGTNDPLSYFKERTGVTLGDDGKVTEVNVGPLKEYTSIKDIMGSVKVTQAETMKAKADAIELKKKLTETKDNIN